VDIHSITAKISKTVQPGPKPRGAAHKSQCHLIYLHSCSPWQVPWLCSLGRLTKNSAQDLQQSC